MIASVIDTATAHHEAGRYREATTELQTWLDKHPQDAAAHAQLGYALLLDKQDEAASAAIERALAIAPMLPVVQRNYARLLLKRQKPEAALQAAQAAHQSDPQHPEGCLVLAAALGANNRIDQALLLIADALHLRPGYAEAYANRAVLKLRSNDPVAALADAEAALAIKPHMTQLWGLVASLRHQFKNLTGAIEALQKVLAFEPDNVGHKVNLGEFLSQNKQTDAAIAILRQAVAQAPDNVAAWTNLGGALQDAKRTDEARLAYALALNLNPNSAEVASNLGGMAKEEENWELALQYFDQALKIKPDFAAFLLNRAKALLALERYGEAEDVIRKVVDTDSTHLEASLALSSSLIGQKRYHDALILLNSIEPPLAADSEDSYRLANAHVRLFAAQRRWSDAEDWARKALTAKPNAAEILWQLAIILNELKRYDEALELLKEVLVLIPIHTGSILSLSSHHARLKNWPNAEIWARRALAAKPREVAALRKLAVILEELERPSESLKLLKKALTQSPEDCETLRTLASHHDRLELWTDTERWAQRILYIRTDSAEAYFDLGSAIHSQGRLDEASQRYRQALSMKPNYAKAFSNLGHVFKNQGRIDEGITIYLHALSIRPDLAETHYNLGNAFLGDGCQDKAAEIFRQAISIKPDYAEAHNSLGNALLDQGRQQEAVKSYRQALSIKPDYADVHFNLGAINKIQGKLREAIIWLRQALLIKPDFAEAHNNLGNAFLGQGRLEEAVERFQQALFIKPEFAGAHTNLIFTLDLSTDSATASLQAERRRWGRTHTDPLFSFPSFSNTPDPERRLRIGYVSADFRGHSASTAFGAMLVHFDPARFEVFAYSNSAMEDTRTRLFQASVTGWRNILRLSDDATVNLIRQDQIDILVDLSGHTAGNRLKVFARKPAPIQVMAWGYGGGTGMKAMDAYFADPVVVPPEEKHFYTEQVRYLPSVFSTFFPDPFPDVAALPALAAGRITFGSFNRLAKLSDQTFAMWVAVLQAHPDSRMVLKAGELDDARMRDRVLQPFLGAGIDPARVRLLGKSTWLDHQAAFNQIDIALDPFPQGGGVTTLEGLMMGVPVLTRRGATLNSRASASVLTTLDLTDWIAESADQYVEIAVQKAQDLAALAQLRQGLRPRFLASIIGDNQAYVRAAEDEYRQLWQEWCDRQTVTPVFLH